MGLPVAVALAGSARALLSPGPTHGCCRYPLRVGRLSDDAPPWVYVGEEGVCCATGFIPEAETMILNEMQVSETFVSVGSTAKYQQKMYDALDDGSIDVMFQGPIYEPWKGYKLSMPFYDAVNGVVVRKTQKARGPWGVLQPFEAELWFALILAVAAGRVGQYRGWVILLGGDARDWRTWPQRLFRVGFLLLALVVGATYAANFAAFLSNAEYEYSGPADVDEMQQYSHCILYEAWLDDYYEDYVDAAEARYPERDPASTRRPRTSTCATASSSTARPAPRGSDLARISLGSMISLFVVYAAAGALALLFHAATNRSECERAVSRRMAPSTPDVDEIYEASPVEAVVDVADADVADEAPAADVSGEKKPRKRKYRKRRAPPPASDDAFSSAPLSDDELAAEPRNTDEDSSCACGVGY
ncbi:hypothetical protein JL722_3558 [Aureococcus anophagefferens]|nr:hypothetical protein JL722_3558 [Aureococcus anophagefferens]